MAIRVSSSSLLTDEEPQNQPTKCWSWSIFPMIIWMRILGVDLREISADSSVQRHHRWLMFLYSGFCFLCHLAGQIDILYYLQRNQKQGSLERSGGLHFDTSTAAWNAVIDFVNYALHGIGTHVIMLTVVRKRWMDLMDTFHRSKDVFTHDKYIQIRKIATFGVAYVIFLILGLISVSIGYHWAEGTSTRHRIFISFMSTISIIYPLTAIVIFVIHCYVSSLLFESIQSQIIQCEIQLLNGRDEDVRFLLFTLKERHILACDTVDGINRCFGWTLLLSVIFFFVAVINSSFYLFGLDNRISLPDVTFTVFSLTHLTLLCFTADRVQIKAEDVITELYRLKCDEPLKGSQMQLMNSLVWEMAKTIPRISANSYFNVSKRLFPQVIGTMMTYSFILFQFEASEKNAD